MNILSKVLLSIIALVFSLSVYSNGKVETQTIEESTIGMCYVYFSHKLDVTKSDQEIAGSFKKYYQKYYGIELTDVIASRFIKRLYRDESKKHLFLEKYRKNCEPIVSLVKGDLGNT